MVALRGLTWYSSFPKATNNAVNLKPPCGRQEISARSEVNIPLESLSPASRKFQIEPLKLSQRWRCRMGPALASPSTLNTPLHTLNCTAFAIASAADNIVLKGPGPRAV